MVSINELKKKVSPSNDYVFKKIKIDGKTIFLIFNDVLTDGGSIDENILRKLVLLNRKELKHIENYLPIRNIKIIKNEEILYYVNNGYLVIVANKIYACEVKAKLDRGINMVDGELTIAGPKDSFTTSTNL